MNNETVIQEIANKSGVDSRYVAITLEFFVNVIKKSFLTGEKVRLGQFETFIIIPSSQIKWLTPLTKTTFKKSSIILSEDDLTGQKR